MRADSQTDRAKFARHRGLKSSFAAVAWRASSQKKPSANPDRVLMPTCASGELQEISGRAVVSAAASNFRAAVAKGIGGYGHEAGTATCIRQLYIAFPQMRLVRPNLAGCMARRSPSRPGSVLFYAVERKSKIVLTRDVLRKRASGVLKAGPSLRRQTASFCR